MSEQATAVTQESATAPTAGLAIAVGRRDTFSDVALATFVDDFAFDDFFALSADAA